MKGKELLSPPGHTAFALQVDCLEVWWVYSYYRCLQVLSQAPLNPCVQRLSCMLSLWADAAGVHLLCRPGGRCRCPGAASTHTCTAATCKGCIDASITMCNGKSQALGLKPDHLWLVKEGEELIEAVRDATSQDVPNHMAPHD